jgi:hypothetical protein
MAYNTGSDPTLVEAISRAFVPEIFTKKWLMHTKSNLVCANAFNRAYEGDLTKGYKVSIPVFTEGSATEVTPGTEPTAVDASTTAVSITVDNWYEASAEISDLIKIEQLANYLTGAEESIQFILEKKIDTSIGVLFSALSSSSVYGADGQTFTDEIFRALVETLDMIDVPDDNRVLIGDASTKRDMLDIEKFISNQYIKSGSPVMSGQVGELYGAKILITNNLTASTTGNYGVYSHRDAIGVVLQKNPRVRVYDMGYKFITKIICDAAWGADEIRDTFGKAFYTRKS